MLNLKSVSSFRGPLQCELLGHEVANISRQEAVKTLVLSLPETK